MSSAAVILRNVTSNWLGFAVGAFISLLLTPLVLRELGPARYGIWILTQSIIGYYGILDLGFRAGLSQRLTRSLAVGEFVVASEYLSSAALAFMGFGAFLASVTTAVAFLAPHVFDVPPEVASETFWCILIVGIGSSIQYVFFPYAAILPAAQRFDIANLIGISTRLLTAAGIVLALHLDSGLVGVSAAAFSANVVDYMLRWRLSRRVVPELRFSRHLATFARLRDIFSFGFWNLLISINYYAFQHVPNIIIASFMRLPAVGQYALATGLSQQISSVLNPIGQVLYPAATALHAQDNRAGLERLYHDGSRMMMLVMVSVVLIAWFWADDFYRLWIGEEYLTGTPYHSVALILRVLLLSTVTTYVTNVGGQMLMGAGKIRIVAIALISGSLLSLLLSLILVPRFGLLGISVAVVIASSIIDLIVIPLLVQHALGLRISSFLRRACVRPATVCALDILLLIPLKLTAHADTWPHIVLVGIIAGGICAATAFTVGINRSERQRILAWLFRRRATA